MTPHLASCRTQIPVINFTSPRGLDYDPTSGTIFLVDSESRRIFEFTLQGSVVQSWLYSSISLPQDVAVDPRDGTLWFAQFGGDVDHRTRTGQLIGSFSTGMNQNGIALDTRNNSLLVLQSFSSPGQQDDNLFEFSTDGASLGQLLDDQLPGNGLGLAYDSESGTLYATSAVTGGPGNVRVFRDPTRVPEPTSGAAIIVLTILSRRTSKR